MNTTDLSIVIVNFNTKEYIKTCLNSIFKNVTAIKYEIIVVDNNSNDGSVEMLKKEFPMVKLSANNKNLGFAEANNEGVRLSKGRYLLLLNPDTKVLPNSINLLFKFIENYPDIGIVAPMLLNEDMSLQRSCRIFPGLLYTISKAFGFPKYMPNHPLLGSVRIKGWDHDKIKEVDQPQGACLMIRRNILDSNDIFDKRFYMYYEEVDLCYRVKKKKYRIYFIPDAKVIHYSGKSFSKNMPRMIYYMYKSKFLFYKKHFNIIKQSLLYLLILFEMVYRISIYSYIGLTTSQRRKEVKLRIKGYVNVLSNFMNGKLPNL